MRNLKADKNVFCRKDDGSAIVLCLMVLVLVSIIGVMSIRTSNSDIEISTNHQLYERSFYAAESARAYVMDNSDLFHDNNLDKDEPVSFPDPDNPATTRQVTTGSPEAFKGSVRYLGDGQPPPGTSSGFRAYYYSINCEGHYYGRSDTVVQLQATFHRIGFKR
jgi:hypothetical protein